MSIVHLSDMLFSNGRGLKAVATAASRPTTCANLTATASSDRHIRVTPPLAFEVEEFDSQIPEENWRHRHGVSQTFDLPSTGSWRTR